MNFLIQISVFIVVLRCAEVKCKPHFGRKHIVKTFHFGIVPLPPKHVSLSLEKITPFGTFALQHNINKRQAAEAEISPVASEGEGVEAIANEEAPKVVETPNAELVESKLAPEVIINTVVEPIESGKQVSFLLPVDSEVVITPAKKEVVDSVLLSSETSEIVESKLQEIVPPPNPIVDIPPESLEVSPPQEPQLVVPNVVITTPQESSVPPVFSVPIFQNPNTPVITPVVNSIPNNPFLYTNINRMPFYVPSNFVPFITSAGVPGVLVPPPPVGLPPPVKEVPPVIREETPNFFVKSSRFVLQFGTMMLQMLSQFVNGRANLNQIPVQPSLPGLQ